MTVTLADIKDWFDAGVDTGQAYMVVLTDTFDHSSFPSYAETSEHARVILADLDTEGTMLRAEEVYDLRMDKAEQMAEARAWHPPPPPEVEQAEAEAYAEREEREFAAWLTSVEDPTCWRSLDNESCPCCDETHEVIHELVVELRKLKGLTCSS